MNLDITYNIALKEARKEYSYKEDALKLALEIFENLDSTDISRSKLSSFFDFILEMHGEKIYQQITACYDGAKVDLRKLLRTHDEKILSCIPRFASEVQQFQLLQFQVLDALANIKASIFDTHGLKFSLIKTCFSPKQAFEYYEKLLSKFTNTNIEQCENWFCKTIYSTEDEQEVWNAMRYVVLEKILKSLSQFITDLRVISPKIANISSFQKEIRYFIDFLGIEVKFKDNKYFFEPDTSYIPAIPILKGRFAGILQLYISQTKQAEVHDSSVARVNSYLTEQDLEKYIKNYHNTNKIKNSFVELETLFQGEAGLLYLKMSSSLTTKLTIGAFVSLLFVSFLLSSNILFVITVLIFGLIFSIMLTS